MDRRKSFRERIILKVIVSILIATGLLFGASTFGGFFFLLEPILSEGTIIMLFQLLYSLSFVIVFGIWFLKENKESKKELFPKKGDFGVVTTICMIVGMYAASLTGSGLLYMTGLYDNGDFYNEATAIFLTAPLFLEILTVAIIAPIGEEFLYRGVIFKNLRRKYNFWAAAIITSLIFSIWHMNLYQGLAVFPLALFFAYLYERFGKIWVPIAAHIWNNLLATLINRFLVSEITTEELELGVGEEYVQLAIAISGMVTFIMGSGILFLMSFCLYKSKYPKNKERNQMMKPVLFDIDKEKIKRAEEEKLQQE